MCFTIEIKLTRDAIEKRFKVDTSVLEDFSFMYFYRAFDMPHIPVVTQDNPDQISLMRWGLIPAWTSSRQQADKIRTGTFNARGETLHEKPSFRSSFNKKRCWVIVHGFFEWQHRKNLKVPWYITRTDDQPFALAGLYDSWQDPDEGITENTFSIVTCRANPMMEKIHNTKKRMPVILPSETEDTWLDAEAPRNTLSGLLKPFNEQALTAHPVPKIIASGNANPGDPAVIQRTEYPEDQELF